MTGLFYSDLVCAERDGKFSHDALLDSLRDPPANFWEHIETNVANYSEGAFRYWLIMSAKGTEVSFQYNVWNNSQPERYLVSIGDRDKLGNFELLANGDTVSSGSFVSREVGLAILREFVGNPKAIPAATSWIDTTELAWPEPNQY